MANKQQENGKITKERKGKADLFLIIIFFV